MTRMLDEDRDDLRPPERELTLSTGTLLGIFLALVLLCGAFFGFGYRLGSRSSKTAPVIGASNPQDTQPANDLFNSFKPAAGSPAAAGETAGGGTEAGAGSAASAAGSGTGAQPGSPAVAGGAAAGGAATAAARAGAPVVVTTPEAPAAAGQFVVQVAAVSHEEDAELLVSALRSKGYPVSAHTEPQDKFFHIQVGPFNSLQEANAAKQRLLADGYQPIIK